MSHCTYDTTLFVRPTCKFYSSFVSCGRSTAFCANVCGETIVNLLSLAVGLVVWIADQKLCDRLHALPTGNPQFHAWWHVLASSGLYFLTLTTAFDAVRASGGTPVIRWWCGAVPWCDRKAQRE